jgi:hypothetical protein
MDYYRDASGEGAKPAKLELSANAGKVTQ